MSDDTLTNFVLSEETLKEIYITLLFMEKELEFMEEELGDLVDRVVDIKNLLPDFPA